MIFILVMFTSVALGALVSFFGWASQVVFGTPFNSDKTFVAGLAVGVILWILLGVGYIWSQIKEDSLYGK